MTHYDILGVDRNASEEDIKRAYRAKAIQYHPDKNKDNQEEAAKQFKKITDAFVVLSDVKQRQLYDLRLPKAPKPKTSRAEQEKRQSVYNSSFKVMDAKPPARDIWGNPLTPEAQKQWIEDLKTDPRHMKKTRANRGSNAGPKLMYDDYVLEDSLYEDDIYLR